MSQTVFPLRYRLIAIPNISSPMELPHNLSTKAFLHRVPMKQSVLGVANEDRSPMLEFLFASDISAFVRTLMLVLPQRSWVPIVHILAIVLACRYQCSLVPYFVGHVNDSKDETVCLRYSVTRLFTFDIHL
jgi:hypothetical protein